jgi:hypothetical protein
MHMWQPAVTAMRAAAILVAMPPEPTAEADAPPIASISGVMWVTRSMKRASACLLGSAVYSPSTSESSTRQSALAICATRAASRSLSP